MTGEFIALIAGRLASYGLALNEGGHVMATNAKLGRQKPVSGY